MVIGSEEFERRAAIAKRGALLKVRRLEKVHHFTFEHVQIVSVGHPPPLASFGEWEHAAQTRPTSDRCRPDKNATFFR